MATNLVGVLASHRSSALDRWSSVMSSPSSSTNSLISCLVGRGGLCFNVSISYLLITLVSSGRPRRGRICSAPFHAYHQAIK